MAAPLSPQLRGLHCLERIMILKSLRPLWRLSGALLMGATLAAASPAAADDQSRIRLYFDSDGRVSFSLNSHPHHRSGPVHGYGRPVYGARHPHFDRHYHYGYRGHHPRGRRHGHGRRHAYCERLTDRSYYRGRPAIVSYRVCFSPRGHAYVVDGSRYLVRYVGRGHRHHRGRYRHRH